MTDKSQLTTLLAIGGLDPTGAAGILLDGAAARSVGVHGAAICTVATIQNGERFFQSRPEDPDIVSSGIESILSTIPIGAIKTGALGNGRIVSVVAKIASRRPSLPLVIDPVISSTSGGVLLNDSGVRALKSQLMGHATLITPNVPEAELLTGRRLSSADEMPMMARQFIEMGAESVLIKGGHLGGNDVRDVFLDRTGKTEVFSSERIATESVRGTGCALAAIVASLLARGQNILPAIKTARKMVHEGIRSARRVGSGPPILFLSPSCTLD